MNLPPGWPIGLEDRLPAPLAAISKLGGNYLLRLADGSAIFAKAGSAPGLEAEAAGLRWLAEAEGLVVELLGHKDTFLLTRWCEPVQADPDAARRFGARLARLHRLGAPSFGAPWAGFIGPLPMDNSPATDWIAFYGSQRVLPYVTQAVDRGAMTLSQARDVKEALDAAQGLPGLDEAPSRIHGDLWSGNVVWTSRGACIVDPAAHGGHRETDLGMLQLFGLPYLEDAIGGYDREYPLMAGWRERVPLHQLHPLAVHAVLFGPSYGHQCAAAARSFLASRA